MEWTGQCVGTVIDSVDATDVATIGGIVCVISNLLGVIAPLLGLAALAMIIYSGAKMIMGAENPKEVAAAQQTLTFAIIGFIGITAAWLILIVIQNLTGANVTEIQFPTSQ